MKENTPSWNDASIEGSYKFDSVIQDYLLNEKARKKRLRIGWTTNGDLFLRMVRWGCVQISLKVWSRELGNLGPFTAAFGQVEHLLIKAMWVRSRCRNNGNQITCERTAGLVQHTGKKRSSNYSRWCWRRCWSNDERRTTRNQRRCRH